MVDKKDLPVVVVYSGYSRSGKTTTMNKSLTSLGYEIVSTSQALHAVTRSFIYELTGYDPDTYNKGKLGWLLNLKVPSILLGEQPPTEYNKRIDNMRDVLIAVAEKVLVPIFGRRIFASYAAEKITKGLEAGKMMAFESIGGSELEIFEFIISRRLFQEIVFLNIRRETEVPGADYRQLIARGMDIQNNGTREEFLQELTTVLVEEEAKKCF